MQITIDSKEIKQVLLDWCNTKFGDGFVTVVVHASYGTLNSAEFIKETEHAQPKADE